VVKKGEGKAANEEGEKNNSAEPYGVCGKTNSGLGRCGASEKVKNSQQRGGNRKKVSARDTAALRSMQRAVVTCSGRELVRTIQRGEKRGFVPRGRGASIRHDATNTEDTSVRAPQPV